MTDFVEFAMKVKYGNELFHLICLMATMAMVIYGIRRYLLNESTSRVDFQAFATKSKDIYPTVSICVHGTYFNRAAFVVENRLIDATKNTSIKGIDYVDLNL